MCRDLIEKVEYRQKSPEKLTSISVTLSIIIMIIIIMFISSKRHIKVQSYRHDMNKISTRLQT